MKTLSAYPQIINKIEGHFYTPIHPISSVKQALRVSLCKCCAGLRAECKSFVELCCRNYSEGRAAANPSVNLSNTTTGSL